MFNKGITSMIIFLLTFFYTKVYADAQNDTNIITNVEYIPKKGYMIDMKDFPNYDLNTIINGSDKNITDDEQLKLELFKFSTINTPKIWLDEWKKNDNDLYERYKENMKIPDPNNNDTMYQLLVMSRNSYVPPMAEDWVDLTEYGWDILVAFGWNGDSNDKTANNVRGYLFVNENKKVIVVSIKGTSAGLFGIGGPTAENDKYNDNMMFSCCCGMVDRTWKGICGCHSGISNTCEMKCLKDESKNYKNSYYEQLKAIIDDIQSYRHKGYEIFFTGHSLGGALASLSGLNMMAPVVTFEAPGERQFAKRLGLIDTYIDSETYKDIYNNIPIYHFGNNGDPIYLGKCTGITSACYYSGFAMETKCHVGKIYMFDLDKNISNPNEPNDDEPNNDEQDDNGDNNSKENSETGTSNVFSVHKKQRIFLNNKSSIYEHQLYMKRSKMLETNKVDSSFTVPSNPSKLNMLHHRVDYVINLIKKWEGPWPTETYQDDCQDCENWTFIEGDGDEGRVEPP